MIHRSRRKRRSTTQVRADERALNWVMQGLEDFGETVRNAVRPTAYFTEGYKFAYVRDLLIYIVLLFVGGLFSIVLSLNLGSIQSKALAALVIYPVMALVFRQLRHNMYYDIVQWRNAFTIPALLGTLVLTALFRDILGSIAVIGPNRANLILGVVLGLGFLYGLLEVRHWKIWNYLPRWGRPQAAPAPERPARERQRSPRRDQ